MSSRSQTRVDTEPGDRGLSLPWFKPPRAHRHSIGSVLLAVVLCTSLVALALAVGTTLEQLLHIQNLLLVFLPVVLFAAVRYGFWLAAWVSLLSVLGTSFLLAAPRFSFAVSEPANIWALAIFILTAAFTSSLAAQVRQRAADADYHSRVVEQLYGMSSQLAGIASTGELVAGIVRQTSAVLGLDVEVVLREAGVIRSYRGSDAGTMLPPSERAAAETCWRESLSAGSGTDRHADADWRYWPLRTAHGVVGVLRARSDQLAAAPRLLDSRQFEALCDLAAVNLERTALAEERRKNEVLAEAEKLRTALLTSISHDLRTPLASILGNVTSLRLYGHLYDVQTREEMLEMAEVETLRLARFVDNLLHMTRIDAGALRPNMEMIDVAEVVGSALQRLSKQLVRHDVRVHVADELPMILADFTLLEHVVANLLDNAVKYAPAGSAIEIEVTLAAESVVLTVRDEGPGIPSADLEHIFERFFRVAAADHRPAGTGLGLAICRSFVEAMGGSIRAANRVDRTGAEFTVRLPVKSA